MSQKSGTPKLSSERIVKDIRRATRKQYSAEEKIRIVLDGLRGEHSIAELCRREGIAESLYTNEGFSLESAVVICPVLCARSPSKDCELVICRRSRLWSLLNARPNPICDSYNQKLRLTE